jgi:threonyl-tRNA synthetase
MAQAIMELFPKDSVQLGIGPTIENGFYYDIEMNSKLTEEHLKQIEEKMKEIIKRNLPVIRHEVSRAEALGLCEVPQPRLALCDGRRVCG